MANAAKRELVGTRMVLGVAGVLGALASIAMVTGSANGVGQLLGREEIPPAVMGATVASTIVLVGGALALGRHSPAGWLAGLFALVVLVGWAALPSFAVAWVLGMYGDAGFDIGLVLAAVPPLLLALLLARAMWSSRRAYFGDDGIDVRHNDDGSVDDATRQGV
jgi:hypothetical protein